MGKNVLVFINSEVGGAERMSVNISKILINNGYNVKYVIIQDEKLKKHSTSIIDFIPFKEKVLVLISRNHLDKIIKLYRIIINEKPDIVFSSHYNINDKILLLKPFFSRIKFIIRAENNYMTFSAIGKFIIKMTYNKADVVIAQTKEMRDEFIENKVLSPNKVFALGNPVDKEYINNKLKNSISPYPNDDKKHIVAVGRIAYQKGYDYLIKALAYVRKKDVNVDLYIVGSYSGIWKAEYERILELVNNLNLEKYVHFIGYNDNPYIYIKHSDCFVLSSRWEGLPNVLAEALYLQKPVAAFKCIPIIERMVRNGIDGYLAENENSEKLADAIINALKLEKTTPIYSGASNEEFLKLF